MVGRPWRRGFSGKFALIFAAKRFEMAALTWNVPAAACSPRLCGAAERPSP
jgi:hypothetical protein